MAAGLYNLTGGSAIEQGATFTRTLTYTNDAGAPVDLTGYTAQLMIRPTPQSDRVLFTLTTTNSRISITPASGIIALTIAAADTAAMTFTSGYYDLTLTSGTGVVTRLLEGAVEVKPGVSR